MLRRGGTMNASAQEASSPRSVNDEVFDDSPNECAPLEDSASTKGPSADRLSASETAEQPAPNRIPISQDHDSPPAGVRAEAPEASQPPWKQKRPRRAFAGDV